MKTQVQYKIKIQLYLYKSLPKDDIQIKNAKRPISSFKQFTVPLGFITDSENLNRRRKLSSQNRARPEGPTNKSEYDRNSLLELPINKLAGARVCQDVYACMCMCVHGIGNRYGPSPAPIFPGRLKYRPAASTAAIAPVIGHFQRRDYRLSGRVSITLFICKLIHYNCSVKVAALPLPRPSLLYPVVRGAIIVAWARYVVKFILRIIRQGLSQTINRSSGFIS